MKAYCTNCGLPKQNLTDGFCKDCLQLCAKCNDCGNMYKVLDMSIVVYSQPMRYLCKNCYEKILNSIKTIPTDESAKQTVKTFDKIIESGNVPKDQQVGGVNKQDFINLYKKKF